MSTQLYSPQQIKICQDKIHDILIGSTLPLMKYTNRMRGIKEKDYSMYRRDKIEFIKLNLYKTFVNGAYVKDIFIDSPVFIYDAAFNSMNFFVISAIDPLSAIYNHEDFSDMKFLLNFSFKFNKNDTLSFEGDHIKCAGSNFLYDVKIASTRKQYESFDKFMATFPQILFKVINTTLVYFEEEFLPKQKIESSKHKTESV